MGLPKNSRIALLSSVSHLQGNPVFHSRRHWLIHLRCHLAKNSHSALIKTKSLTQARGCFGERPLFTATFALKFLDAFHVFARLLPIVFLLAFSDFLSLMKTCCRQGQRLKRPEQYPVSAGLFGVTIVPKC